MHEFAVGAPALARVRKHFALRGALLFCRTSLGGAEGFPPLRRPTPDVAWNLETFEKLQNIATRRANVACTTKRAVRPRVKDGVKRKGNNQPTKLLGKLHDVVDLQAQVVVHHSAHNSPRRGAGN